MKKDIDRKERNSFAKKMFGCCIIGILCWYFIIHVYHCCDVFAMWALVKIWPIPEGSRAEWRTWMLRNWIRNIYKHIHEEGKICLLKTYLDRIYLSLCVYICILLRLSPNEQAHSFFFYMDQAHEKHRNELLGWYSTSALPKNRYRKTIEKYDWNKAEFANNRPRKKKTQERKGK